MSVVTTQIDIAAPPEKVWDIVMDPGRLSDWVTIHRKLGNVSDRPLKEGSEFDQTLHMRGANFKVRWRIEQLDAPHRAEWKGRGPAHSYAQTSYRLEPDGNGGTRFHYRNEFKAPGGPLGAVASRVVVGDLPEREAKRTLANLKRLLEG